MQGLREEQPCTWLALVRSIGRALDNQELKRAQKSSVQQKVTGIAEPWDSVVQGQDSGCVPWPLHATGAWKIGARERTEHTLRRNTSHGPRYIQKPRMTHKPAPCSDCCLQTCLIPLDFCHLQSIFFFNHTRDNIILCLLFSSFHPMRGPYHVNGKHIALFNSCEGTKHCFAPKQTYLFIPGPTSFLSALLLQLFI